MSYFLSKTDFFMREYIRANGGSNSGKRRIRTIKVIDPNDSSCCLINLFHRFCVTLAGLSTRNHLSLAIAWGLVFRLKFSVVSCFLSHQL